MNCVILHAWENKGLSKTDTDETNQKIFSPSKREARRDRCIGVDIGIGIVRWKYDTTRFKQTENNSPIYPPLLFLTFAFYVGAATSPKRGNTPAGQQTTHNSSVRYDEAQITSRGVGFFLMIIWPSSSILAKLHPPPPLQTQRHSFFQKWTLPLRIS